MKIIDIIENKINRFPKDYVFSYQDFDIDIEKTDTIRKTLNNLEKAGKITKLSKGKYYKPRQTEFGASTPAVKQIVKDLLEQDGKTVGYLTGLSVYNSLYLTTQIAGGLQIGTNKYRRAINRGQYKISFVLQHNTINKENVELLQILDAVRFINHVPAIAPDDACKRFLQIFSELSPEKQQRLARLSLKYTNYVRALCGAMLEQVGAEKETLDKIKKSLNGISFFKFSIADKTLTTKSNWNIIN